MLLTALFSKKNLLFSRRFIPTPFPLKENPVRRCLKFDIMTEKHKHFLIYILKLITTYLNDTGNKVILTVTKFQFQYPRRSLSIKCESRSRKHGIIKGRWLNKLRMVKE